MKRYCWLSQCGHEKLNYIRRAYFEVERDAGRKTRIQEDQLIAPLAQDTGVDRTTIRKIFSHAQEQTKENRVQIQSIENFFENLAHHLAAFRFRPYLDNPNDFQLNKETDIDFDELIQGTATSNISSGDWHTLFNLLQDIVLEDTIAACKQAFLVCKRSDPCHLEERKTLEDVKRILSEEDKPEIAVQFANAIIRRVRGSLRDNVIEWRDRLAKQYSITVTAPETTDAEPFISAYLLIILKPSGYGGVLLEARLHLEAEGKKPDIIPIEINVDSDADEPIRCSLDRVPEYLPKLIDFVEKYLVSIQQAKGCSQDISLTLEVFLPDNDLDYRVDKWEWEVDDEETTTLGEEYVVAVRSLGRLKWKRLRELGNRWNSLQEAIRNSTILPAFYSLNNNESDIDYKNLPGELKKYIGLKWPNQLPENEGDRRQLFRCIFKSGVPVVMWVSPPKVTPEKTLEEFDRLLTAENLSDFCSFSRQIQEVRGNDQHPLENIGLLWDCPHRTPLMPTINAPLKIPQK